ncbi:hypothetical protein ACFL6A_02495 [bacterium]
MKIVIFGLLVCALLLLTFSCNHITEPGAGFQWPYLNSFETGEDTTGWRGNGFFDLRDSAAPGGGSQSLFVAGGCPIPHAFYDLDIAGEECALQLRCWGKNLAIGGSVTLQLVNNPSREITISITDTAWTFYESAQTLTCPSDDAVRITMNSGGYAPSSMLVDLLEIVRVE